MHFTPPGNIQTIPSVSTEEISPLEGTVYESECAVAVTKIISPDPIPKDEVELTNDEDARDEVGTESSDDQTTTSRPLGDDISNAMDFVPNDREQDQMEIAEISTTIDEYATFAVRDHCPQDISDETLHLDSMEAISMVGLLESPVVQAIIVDAALSKTDQVVIINFPVVDAEKVVVTQSEDIKLAQRIEQETECIEETNNEQETDASGFQEDIASPTDAEISPTNSDEILTAQTPDLVILTDHIETPDHSYFPSSPNSAQAIEASMDHNEVVSPKANELNDDSIFLSSPRSPITRSPTSRLVQRAMADPPTPTLEDVTATITLGSLAQLEDDKAILRSFLDRMAVSKESKPELTPPEDANYARRESLQNRRDSDVVRQALASPRQPLEDKDGNTFSPQKLPLASSANSPLTNVVTKDENVTELERIIPSIDELLAKPIEKGSPRRSSRSKSTRVASSTTDRKTIAVRRNDGNDTINLTKTDAQLVAVETRRNTRKNKGPCLNVQDTLVKWRAELVVHGKDGDTPEPKTLQTEQKGVRWSQTLWFLNETTGLSEQAPLVDNTPAPTVNPIAILLPGPESSSTDSETNTSRPRRASRSQTPRIRRLRGLGTMNGTPAKNILASTLLPDEVTEPTEELTLTQIPEKPPTMTLSAIATSTVKNNKSRLQQPTKLNLNPSIKSVVSAAAENKESVAKTVQAKKSTTAAGASKKSASMLPVAGTSKKRTTRNLT